jgi:hypothetical protein
MSTEEENIFPGELTDLHLERMLGTWQMGEVADRRVEEADTWAAMVFLVYEGKFCVDFGRGSSSF